MPTNIAFKDAEELLNFLNLIAERTKQKLDKKNPTLDVAHRGFNIHLTLAVQPGNSKFTFKRVE